MTCYCILALQFMLARLELNTLSYHEWLPGHTVFLCMPLLNTKLHTCIVYAIILNFLILLFTDYTSMTGPWHFDPIHMWLSVHATWFHFTYPLGCFLTTLYLHVQIREIGPRQILFEDLAFLVKQADQLQFIPDMSPLTNFRDPFFVTREHSFVLFTPCNLLFCAFWWCNIML